MTQAIDELLKNRDYDGALAATKVLLGLHPTNAKLQAYAGLCHFRKAEYAPAAVFLQKAFLLDPSYIDAGIKLAIALDRLKRYREAYEVAKDVLKIDPNNDYLIGLTQHLLEHDVEEHDGWEKTARLDSYRIIMTSQE